MCETRMGKTNLIDSNKWQNNEPGNRKDRVFISAESEAVNHQTMTYSKHVTFFKQMETPLSIKDFFLSAANKQFSCVHGYTALVIITVCVTKHRVMVTASHVTHYTSDGRLLLDLFLLFRTNKQTNAHFETEAVRATVSILHCNAALVWKPSPWDLLQPPSPNIYSFYNSLSCCAGVKWHYDMIPTQNRTSCELSINHPLPLVI